MVKLTKAQKETLKEKGYYWRRAKTKGMGHVWVAWERFYPNGK